MVIPHELPSTNDVLTPDHASGVDPAADSCQATVRHAEATRERAGLLDCKNGQLQTQGYQRKGVVCNLLEVANALQPVAHALHRHLCTEAGAHTPVQQLIPAQTIHPLRLVKKRPQTDPSLLTQPRVPDHVVDLIHRIAKCDAVLVQRGHHPAGTTDNVCPDATSDEHEEHAAEVFCVILRRDVAVSNGCEGHHSPVHGCEVHPKRAAQLAVALARFQVRQPTLVAGHVRQHAPAAAQPMAEESNQDDKLDELQFAVRDGDAGLVAGNQPRGLDHPHQLQQA
mmetsp:Transcript_82848/g.221366  ORF Transcript_82848/g.221366 Transcript_82848/m.221366 type:complete len:282 (-) Transcript_82848:567-1412(-)